MIQREHCDSPHPPESDLDGDQIRNVLASPLYLQEREASADRSRVYHPYRENSVSSSSHFRASVGRPAAVFSHERKSSQESRSDREGISLAHRAVRGENVALSRLSDSENAARQALEEQRDHLPAEAKTEEMKQECRADFLDCSVRELKRPIHSNLLEMDYANDGYEESRREQSRLQEELAQREKTLRETHNRSIHAAEGLKRAQEMRIDDFSRHDLRESQATIQAPHKCKSYRKE